MSRMPTTPPRDHRALRLVLQQSALGAALGLAFAGALVLVDAHGIGSLMARSDSGLVAFAMLAVGFMVTGGSLVAGGAIMLIGSGEQRGDRPNGGMPALVPVLVPARAAGRERAGFRPR